MHSAGALLLAEASRSATARSETEMARSGEKPGTNVTKHFGAGLGSGEVAFRGRQLWKKPGSLEPNAEDGDQPLGSSKYRVPR